MQIFRVILYKNTSTRCNIPITKNHEKIKLLTTFTRNYLLFKDLVHKFAAGVDGKHT